MLVLTRKTNERIVIGEGVEVVVVAIRGGRVQLGIQAAPDIRILRQESSEPEPVPTQHIASPVM